MEKLKPRPDLFLKAGLPALLLSIALLWWAKPLLPTLFCIFCFCWVPLLYWCIQPPVLVKQRSFAFLSSEDADAGNPYRWLGGLGVILIELLFYFMLFGFHQLNLVLAQIPIARADAAQHFFDLLHHQLWLQALYPWGAIAVLVIGFQRIQQNEEQAVWLSDVAKPLTGQGLKGGLSICINNLSQFATYFAMGLLIVSTTLLLVLGGGVLLGLPALQIHVVFSTLVPTLIFIFIARNKSAYRWVRAQLRRGRSVFVMMALWILLITIFLLVLHAFGTRLDVVPIRIPGWLQRWTHAGSWSLNLDLLLQLWSWCFIPILTVLLIPLLSHYSVRQQLFWLLLLPVSLAVWQVVGSASFLNVLQSPTLSFTAPLLSGLALLAWLLRKSTLNSAMYLYLPEASARKRRGVSRFIMMLFFASAMGLYFLLPSGLGPLTDVGLAVLLAEIVAIGFVVVGIIF